MCLCVKKSSLNTSLTSLNYQKKSVLIRVNQWTLTHENQALALSLSHNSAE
jgi:hypothetical protein